MPMTRRLPAAVAAAVLAAMTAAATNGPGAAAQRDADRITLSIVGTNDLHGGVLPTDGRGGLAMLAGYLSNLRDVRSRGRGAVLLIDAGDMWQGTLESNLSEGASVVAAYNALGYTAAAVGNHEFDFGPVGPSATPLTPTDDPRGALKARAAEARFPLLAANLIDQATKRPVSWPNVRPSVTTDVAGIKVGIVGVMTSTALSQTISANTTGLTLAPLAETISAEAGRLRAAGAEVIVVAAHAGGECTRFDDPTDLSSCDAGSEILRVARQVRPGLVDVIVAGHVHEGMAHMVQGTAITSAYSGGIAFGRVDLELDSRTRAVVNRRIFAPRQLCERENPRTQRCDPGDTRRTEVASRYEGKPVRRDAAITRVLAPAVQQTAALKASLLGVLLETPVARAERPESPLGNLFLEALRAAVPGADVAIYNVRGGLRADLPAGPLTYGRVFTVMPFDNRVATLHLTGAELTRVVVAQLQAVPTRLGLAGLSVKAECVNAAPSVTLVRPSGAVVGADERLVVITTDFLAFGGNDILTPVMPNGGFAVPAEAPIARDLIVDWFRKRGGRIRADQLLDPRRPRWSYPGTLPMTCGP
jgi:2',3'-cyclic-nucleotide 2'-phosphodiesterase (5'-nucleotidase family)